MESSPLLEKREEEREGGGDLKNLVLVNVVVAIVSLGTMIAFTVLPQFMYSRVQHELYSNATFHTSTSSAICFRNTSDPNFLLQERVQEVTADRLTDLTLANSIPVIFTILFLGAYVDQLGRKSIFIAALLGHLARNVSLAVVVYFHLGTATLYVGYAIDAVCGGFCSLLLLGYVFTADHTVSLKSRTFAMGAMTVSNTLASTLGDVLTGYAIKYLGFFYPMLIASVLSVVALLIAMVFVKETLHRVDKECISPFTGLGNIFRFYVGRSYEGKRLIFWLALLGFLFSVISAIGGMNIQTLFLFDFPFCWDSVKLGWFTSLSTGIMSLCGLVALKLMQMCFTEGVIALIGSLAFAVYDIYFGLANSDIMVFLSPLFGIFCVGTLPVIRSIISQMVTKDRQGSIFASLAFVEAVCYAAGTPFMNLMYKSTVSVYKGAVFQIMAGMHVIAFFVFLWLIHRTNQYNKRLETERKLNIHTGKEA